MQAVVEAWFFGAPGKKRKVDTGGELDSASGMEEQENSASGMEEQENSASEMEEQELLDPFLKTLPCKEAVRLCSTSKTLHRACEKKGVYKRCDPMRVILERMLAEFNKKTNNEFSHILVLINLMDEDPEKKYKLVEKVLKYYPELVGNIESDTGIHMLRRWLSEATKVGDDKMIGLLTDDDRFKSFIITMGDTLPTYTILKVFKTKPDLITEDSMKKLVLDGFDLTATGMAGYRDEESGDDYSEEVFEVLRGGRFQNLMKNDLEFTERVLHEAEKNRNNPNYQLPDDVLENLRSYTRERVSARGV